MLLEQIQNRTTKIVTGPGASVMRGEAEKPGTAQPAEEKVQGEGLAVQIF